MFSGIIEELGTLKRKLSISGITRLEVCAQNTLAGVKIGDSIALNGVCLTVVALGNNTFSFEVMAQTLKNTNLGLLKIGERINLERALKVGDRVSGHFVLGHVDCLGNIRKKVLRQGSLELEVAVPLKFMPYCLEKGSIALDGISLTLAQKQGNKFTVRIIPHTLKNTTLSFKGPSDKLNVEFDLLAKKLTA